MHAPWQGNILSVAAGDMRADIGHVAEAGRESLEALIESLGRTAAKEMAIDGYEM